MNTRAFVTTFAIPALLAIAASDAVAATDQPYAGQETRDVASLSEADIAALLAGEGWGLAKPAELNGYPGPAHVLDLADELGLTAEQTDEIEAIFEAMRAEAAVLGADYVDTERHLSTMFRMGHADPAMLETLLGRSAEILARLRAVHLKAHLQTTPLLSDEQKETYARLRGYADGPGHAGHSGHGSH